MKALHFICLLILTPSLALAQAPAGTMPDRLVILRGNYERAVERVTAPVRSQYREELLKLKSEYTKNGNLEAALAVDTEIKERFPSAPPVSKNAPLTTSVKFANVDTLGNKLVPLKEGERIFGDADYAWLTIPEGYEGMQFAQPKGKHTAVTKFRVNGDGLVFIAFDSRWADKGETTADGLMSRQGIEKMGWKALSAKHNLKSSDQGVEWVVCSKECKAGDEFTLRTHKYCAPVLLTK
jgi:hypothetical protein